MRARCSTVRSEARTRRRPQGDLPAVGLRPRPDAGTLLEFRFDGTVPDTVYTGLQRLGPGPDREIWQTPGPVVCGADGEVAWRRDARWLAITYQVPDDGRCDLADLAATAYQRILEVARQQACPWLVRAWNFMYRINAGDGDAERYRRFCLGRSRALDAAGVRHSELCAGTAIGSPEPVFRICALAAGEPGIAIENPRQVSAYEYPPIYGPRSPSFARGSALVRDDGSALLLISGTASVVGHETRHPHDLAGQLDEVIINLRTLLDESARILQRPQLGDFDGNSILRAYLRHAGDWPTAEAMLRRVWPGVVLVGFQGDICRQDLLVEVEAVHQCSAV